MCCNQYARWRMRKPHVCAPTGVEEDGTKCSRPSPPRLGCAAVFRSSLKSSWWIVTVINEVWCWTFYRNHGRQSAALGQSVVDVNEQRVFVCPIYSDWFSISVAFSSSKSTYAYNLLALFGERLKIFQRQNLLLFGQVLAGNRVKAINWITFRQPLSTCLSFAWIHLRKPQPLTGANQNGFINTSLTHLNYKAFLVWKHLIRKCWLP